MIVRCRFEPGPRPKIVWIDLGVYNKDDHLLSCAQLRLMHIGCNAEHTEYNTNAYLQVMKCSALNPSP